MSRMWEVDPETRAKLLHVSKTKGNDRCCDCGAPSPQWASPKFGTFICLNCAGTHRGLGVHISFVRSISMDAFKHAETRRMELGGNEPWKAFFDAHAITQSEGRTFEDSTIRERYEGDVGEEWKERLSARVEGREYIAGEKKVGEKKVDTGSRAGTPVRSTPAAEGSDPMMGKKEKNEEYFAKLGTENATRSDTLPPSQGGKYTGFGGGLPASTSPGRGGPGGGGSVPAFDDFQKDPMAALTKGFGWFTTTVGKGAKSVNDSYIQPTAKTISDSDFAAQARVHASQMGQNIQVGARGAADSFNRFVEGPGVEGEGVRGRRMATDPERKDFWDDVSAIGAQEENHRHMGSRSSAIGTAAMRKPGPVGSTAGGGIAGATASSPGTGAGVGAMGNTTAAKEKGDDEGWDENW